MSRMLLILAITHSTQLASFLHPPPQGGQGQRLSRGRGISGIALWLCFF